MKGMGVDGWGMAWVGMEGGAWDGGKGVIPMTTGSFLLILVRCSASNSLEGWREWFANLFTP